MSSFCGKYLQDLCLRFCLVYELRRAQTILLLFHVSLSNDISFTDHNRRVAARPNDRSPRFWQGDMQEKTGIDECLWWTGNQGIQV